MIAKLIEIRIGLIKLVVLFSCLSCVYSVLFISNTPDIYRNRIQNYLAGQPDAELDALRFSYEHENFSELGVVWFATEEVSTRVFAAALLQLTDKGETGGVYELPVWAEGLHEDEKKLRISELDSVRHASKWFRKKLTELKERES